MFLRYVTFLPFISTFQSPWYSFLEKDDVNFGKGIFLSFAGFFGLAAVPSYMGAEGSSSASSQPTTTAHFSDIQGFFEVGF
jgi:hypothetical protein